MPPLTAYDSDVFSNNVRDEQYCEFMSLGPNLIDAAQRKAKLSGRQWFQREVKQVKALIIEMKDSFQYWAENGDSQLMNVFLKIVHEMAQQIETQSLKSKRRLKDVAAIFRLKTLPYLKRESFDPNGAVSFTEFEKTRALVIYVRLFKGLQLFRFDHFCLSESKPEQNANEETSLRGDTIIRNRCKRVDSFRPEAHIFDEYVRNLILRGEIDVDNIYVCLDHKTQNEKCKGLDKPRVVAGLLYYFVCPTPKAAEEVLRRFVQFCENADPAVTEIYQKMFRKHQSTKKCSEAEDLQKRFSLASNETWDAEDFENQKQMYHFTLAIPGEPSPSASAEAHVLDLHVPPSPLGLATAAQPAGVGHAGL